MPNAQWPMAVSELPSPNRAGGALWRGAGGEGFVHDDLGHSFSTLLCATFSTRLRGWLLRAPTVDAILLTPCSSVHFWGVGRPLDVVFVDFTGSVLRHERPTPWSSPLWQVGAWAVFEALSARVPADWRPRRLAWPVRG